MRRLIIALILAGLLALASVVPAFAAGKDVTVTRPTGDPTARGTVLPPDDIVFLGEGHSETSLTAP